MPLVGAVLARYGPAHDRLDGRRVAGLLVGLAGVTALVGFEVKIDDARAVVAIAVVAISYAVGPLILSRSLSDLPAMGVVAVSLLLAAIIYLPAGIAQAPSQWPSGRVIASVVALAGICTALAFLLFFELIAEVGPTRAIVITYLNPAFALVLGVVILDETASAATGIGFGLVLIGSVLATGPGRDRVRPRRRTPGADEATEVACKDMSAPVAEP